MKGCLLCLDISKTLADCININSSECHELNIKTVIEQHLWSMNHIETYEWLCLSCWKELLQFHKFFKSIEEAHKNFGLLIKNTATQDIFDKSEEILTENTDILNNIKRYPIDEIAENQPDDLNVFLNEYDISEHNIETEITIDAEENHLIKLELDEKQLKNDIPLQQKRRRGRPRKEVAVDTKQITKVISYTKENEIRKIRNTCTDINYNDLSSNRTRKQKQSKIPERNCETSSNDNSPSVIKQVPDLPISTEKHSISLANHDEKTNSSNNNDSELDFEPIKMKSISNRTKIERNKKDKFLAENFKITCFMCNIAFETFFAMCKHFEVNHTEPGHVRCCNKKIYRRSILVDHVHRHLDPNYFKCEHCGKVLADRRCLELHLASHEGVQEKNFSCDICGKAFGKLGVLEKHRLIHLSEEEKRFHCSECGKNFGSSYLLSTHKGYVHLKKYAKICDICGKSIVSNDVFERHMLQHEGKTAPTETCDICGLILTDKKALKRHKGICHPEGGKQEYTCSICSKVSPNLRAHKMHVQYKHVMGYDHKCTICDKGFKKAQTLREHMASHIGTVLYTCPWCPKTFNSNANMHNHRKKVHPKEWEEASRKRYSGNLPPNFKPPLTSEPADFSLPMDT